MPNSLLLFTAQIVAILSVLLLAAGYLKTDFKAASNRVFSIMAAFIVLYLLNGMSGPYIEDSFKLDLSAWQLPMQIGINSICGLFMIYCFLIFQEQQRFPLILKIAFGLQIVLDSILSAIAVSNSDTEPTPMLTLLSTSMDILQLFFVGCAIYWTLKGWRADLVDDRRVLRWFTIGVQGTLIFSIVFIENFLLDTGSSEYATEQAAIVFAIAILALGMVLVSMRFDYVSLSYVIRKVTEMTEEPDEENQTAFDIDTFNQQFRDGKLYREAGLTIAVLAKKLNLPEYKLRAFIHKQLGFRNFNAMLHQYRIEDASEALADKSNQSVPVLTIALTVGYQSITPFNNAFRQIMGVTPSEYRKRNANS